MEDNISSLKQHINHIDAELHNLRHRLASIELGMEIIDNKKAKAAEKWLELAKKTRKQWPDDSLSSVEIVKAGRKHA